MDPLQALPCSVIPPSLSAKVESKIPPNEIVPILSKNFPLV